MLTLLRHGETEYNVEPRRYQGRRDIRLTVEGRKAAREIGKKLPRFDGVVCSTAGRCMETVAEFDLKSVPFRYDARLVEIDVGLWEGYTRAEVADWDSAGYFRWCRVPDLVAPGGGESLQAMRWRVLTALTELHAEFAGQRALVVTHGGPIRILRLELDGQGLRAFHGFSVPNLFRLDLSDDLGVPGPDWVGDASARGVPRRANGETD